MSKRAKPYLVHFIAQCKDCDWHTEDHVKGPANASAHASKHRHLVHAETGHYIEYDGRRKPRAN